MLVTQATELVVQVHRLVDVELGATKLFGTGLIYEME